MIWFERNASGVWCNWCHEMIWAPWFDEYESDEDPEYCPNCGGDAEGPE